MLENSKPLRYLALGDSYTIGEGVAITERFPHLAVSILQSQGYDCADPVYLAKTGWTTENLLTAIQHEIIFETFDFVTLLIGVNDQYQNKSIHGYRKRFTELLQHAITFAGNRRDRVFVLSIPDYSVTPFVKPEYKKRVHDEIIAYNRNNQKITEQYSIRYIDIIPYTYEAETDATLLATDGLHYSGKEHGLWAGLLASAIQSSFKKEG